MAYLCAGVFIVFLQIFGGFDFVLLAITLFPASFLMFYYKETRVIMFCIHGWILLPFYICLLPYAKKTPREGERER